MFSGKEILVAGSAIVITVGVVWFLIKWLISAALDYLRETLIELKNNDVKLFDKQIASEKCDIAMKKDIERNKSDIAKIEDDMSKLEEHKKDKD